MIFSEHPGALVDLRSASVTIRAYGAAPPYTVTMMRHNQLLHVWRVAKPEHAEWLVRYLAEFIEAFPDENDYWPRLITDRYTLTSDSPDLVPAHWCGDWEGMEP